MPTSEPTGDRSVRSVVVTGGANGIGLATALRYGRAGYRVALVDLHDQALNEGAQLVAATGAECLLIKADVSDFYEAQAQAAHILECWGQIDVLVNNAGISQTKTLLEISEAEWDRTIAVNLKGYFNWCKAVVPAMMEQGKGRIVNVSSVGAHTGGGPNAASKVAYVTTKAGILGLTRALARELAPVIHANAVCPGAIDTHMTQGHFTPRRAAIEAGIPLRRLGTPEDIAEVIFFLGASEPCFLTGEVIDADGGQWIN